MLLDRCSVLGVSFPWGGPLYPLDGETVHINRSRYITAVRAKYIITKLLALSLLHLCSQTRFNWQLVGLDNQVSRSCLSMVVLATWCGRGNDMSMCYKSIAWTHLLKAFFLIPLPTSHLLFYYIIKYMSKTIYYHTATRKTHWISLYMACTRCGYVKEFRYKVGYSYFTFCFLNNSMGWYVVLMPSVIDCNVNSHEHDGK